MPIASTQDFTWSPKSPLMVKQYQSTARSLIFGGLQKSHSSHSMRIERC
jgi:hypothetical protein